MYSLQDLISYGGDAQSDWQGDGEGHPGTSAQDGDKELGKL